MNSNSYLSDQADLRPRSRWGLASSHLQAGVIHPLGEGIAQCAEATIINHSLAERSPPFLDIKTATDREKAGRLRFPCLPSNAYAPIYAEWARGS